MIVLQGYFFHFISNHHHCRWLTMGKSLLIRWYCCCCCDFVIPGSFPGNFFFIFEVEKTTTRKTLWAEFLKSIRESFQEISITLLFLLLLYIELTNKKLKTFSIFVFVNSIWFWHFFCSPSRIRKRKTLKFCSPGRHQFNFEKSRFVIFK